VRPGCIADRRLRINRYCGYFKPDLAAAIPRVAGWSMTSIPKAIPPHDAQRVLASCDRRSAVGRRDYAMLLLLARLGLRAGEVASLTLDDIDWHAGTLTVHGKGSQESPLPLLEPIGKAIAAYLRRGRPHCKSRRVFLRMHAPIRGFKTEKPVSTAVGRALQRAGIDSPHRGAHQFRHYVSRLTTSGGARVPSEFLGDLAWAPVKSSSITRHSFPASQTL
jgi:integrase